ncbi:hypothetical protein BHU72_04510 [Desulfuribacillus stibiiarsenatis]|uniref:Uncharacterized protein n=1 Tax=Desulfuribacillus stibiiarsenatis TaxID=1390249 RepID=A0A1E5L5G5_9FIRM|nr:hypothetical protein [Desulfuribacillus stibiiarsenatis]OEH85360.1 hypothetical protein BHU72_04510 [Desulfuribacillus stibiiarsenatis]
MEQQNKLMKHKRFYIFVGLILSIFAIVLVLYLFHLPFQQFTRAAASLIYYQDVRGLEMLLYRLGVIAPVASSILVFCTLITIPWSTQSIIIATTNLWGFSISFSIVWCAALLLIALISYGLLSAVSVLQKKPLALPIRLVIIGILLITTVFTWYLVK